MNITLPKRVPLLNIRKAEFCGFPLVVDLKFGCSYNLRHGGAYQSVNSYIKCEGKVSCGIDYVCPW